MNLMNINVIFGYELTVLVHQEDEGDIYDVDDGLQEWIGIKGESKRLELINIDEVSLPSGVSIKYMCHIEDIGDSWWMSGGNDCGTRGESRRLEGFAIKLEGNNANNYNIIYRCHIQDSGDSGFYYDGEYCGTKGQSKRIESIWIDIVNN